MPVDCPLCGQPLLGRGPTMHSVWQEMESNDQQIVVVHIACAWDAVRDKLYARDEAESHFPQWVGWEPMDWMRP